MELITNNAETTTSASINNSSDPVSFTVVDPSKFPSAGNFRVLIDNELLLVTNVSGSTFTAARAQESTTIASHTSGATITHILTAASLFKLLSERAKSPYPIFIPSGIDDEFDDGSFSGWTSVQGSPSITPVENGSQLSLLHPGGGSAGQFSAWMKAATVNTNDYIEACFRVMGGTENFMIAGIIMADGNTYNAGNQTIAFYSPTQNLAFVASHQNYNTNVTNTTFGILAGSPFIFLRLTYLGSNSFKGQISCDGITWINYVPTFSRTLTPTHVGFGLTKWGGSLPMIATLEYFKKGS